MAPRYVKVTEQELRLIVKEAARDGVMEGFKTLGIDTDNIDATQRDFKFLRDKRTTSEAVSRKGVLYLATAVLGIVATLIAAGLKALASNFIQNGGPPPAPPH